jgi:hypothetical protein
MMIALFRAAVYFRYTKSSTVQEGVLPCGRAFHDAVCPPRLGAACGMACTLQRTRSIPDDGAGGPKLDWLLREGRHPRRRRFAPGAIYRALAPDRAKNATSLGPMLIPLQVIGDATRHTAVSTALRVIATSTILTRASGVHMGTRAVSPGGRRLAAVEFRTAMEAWSRLGISTCSQARHGSGPAGVVTGAVMERSGARVEQGSAPLTPHVR